MIHYNTAVYIIYCLVGKIKDLESFDFTLLPVVIY